MNIIKHFNQEEYKGRLAKPFLKWAGGKSRLLGSFLPFIPQNYNRYHEVCIGGGALFFNLRSTGMKQQAFLYDINPELTTTYRAIQSNPRGVIKELSGHALNHSEPYFYKIRELDPRTLTDIQTAGRMLYLNRACFNGLYRVNMKGHFNSPYGKRDTISIPSTTIYADSLALENTEILQGDYACILDHARSGDFVFIDPPYPNGFKAYTSIGFSDTDHSRLHDVCLELNRRNVMFMQTNADCPLIQNIYADFHIHSYLAPRNINCKGSGRGKVGEVLLMNF